MKMAPVPDQQCQEPVASSSSDKSGPSAASSSGSNSSSSGGGVSSAAAATTTITTTSTTTTTTTTSSASSSSSLSSSLTTSAASANGSSPEASGKVAAAASQQELALPILNNTALVDSSSSSKQEETATLSTLNEGELRALLDEAITYKCPKDREGKSNLFKELLEEAEADESEEGRCCWTVTSGTAAAAGGSSRCLLPGGGGAGGGAAAAAGGGGGSSSVGSSVCSSSRCSVGGGVRRSHSRRDSTASSSVAEHLTHGGSLQNLALREHYGEYYCSSSSSSSHYAGSAGGYYGGYGQGGARSRKQSARKGQHAGPSSVSARQREGGSLPSNVNATHTLVASSLANFDLAFEKKKGLSEEKSVYDWTNKEKSKSLDKPSYSKKEEKEKDKKDSKLSGSCDIESESRDKRSSNGGKLGTNEMLESDNPPPEYNKQDCMVIGLDDLEASVISERNASAALGSVQRPRSLDAEDDEGTEMKIIDHRRPVQYITRATLDIPQTPVDSSIEFPTFREHTTKLDKSRINGTEGTSSLPFPPYNNVKCVMSGGSPGVYSVMSWPPPNISMGDFTFFSRLTAQHIGKENLSGDKKSLDENGNAVQSGYIGERKKTRRKNAQEANVIVYKAEKVQGHREEEDIESLVNFIENKDCKTKKGKTSNSVKVKTASNTKSRSRDNKDTKREQITTKLQKSNSLEEISKTKLEDLTAEKGTTSSGSSTVSSQNESVNVTLRRSKQRSIGDAATVDSRGDRRSWGTEEGQSIYCNDTGDDYGSRLNSVKKNNTENEVETEFHVVTNKKKKTKKQRRSSSGGRAQNLSGSGSYLQRGRGFSNDYRTPLSPELRRKSTSSMPPSDKSDSSDLDSVQSLPVTSNSSKHNSSKAATSSTSAPQASYADIARMATLNMSTAPVLNISNLIPNVINTAAWPSVASKNTNSDAEKQLPNDYYPSLDELQNPDRKGRQHNSAQQGAATSFDKPPSPTMSKSKGSPESNKKQEAHEETINKVTKYVQNIENMQQQQSQLQQESSKQSSNNSSPNSNETTPTNPLPPKSPESLSTHSSPSEMDNNSNSDYNSGKDSNTSSKNNIVRVRKSHPPPNPGLSTREYAVSQSQSQTDDFKKVPNLQPEETVKPINNPSQPQQDDKDTKKISSAHNATAGPSEVDLAKSRVVNSSIKLVQQSRPIVDSETIRVNKTDRLPKAIKEPQQVNLKDNSKVCYPQQSLNCRQDKPVDDTDNKKLKQSNSVNKDQKLPEVQMSRTSTPATMSTSRPAVILLDENVGDPDKSTESESSELTFGFEVNEQLLLSEEDEEEMETPTVSPDSSRFSISPPNFSRQPSMFDKHVRCEKFPQNFPVNAFVPMHSIPPHSILVQTAVYMGCPMRYQAPFVLPHQHVPTLPVIEKCRHQPKEDFSSRYIAPDESHIPNFNYEKIVSFVGLAWDDVMRETGSSTSGRVQYYSAQ